MDVKVAETNLDVRSSTRSRLRRMVGSLCGMDKSIVFSLQAPMEPSIMSAGAELTGVHVLLDEAPPKQGAYHIGASGVVREEVLIRVLAETTERYAQVLAERSRRHTITCTSYRELVAKGERVVAPQKLRFFSADQLSSEDFPFAEFHEDAVTGWVKAPSLLEDESVWVPAQLLLLGYRPARETGEPWLAPAVTTGTATHTSGPLALKNAVLELIQIDAAMGHWYSDSAAARILLDDRAAAISRLIAKHFHPRGPQPEFYWLPSPDGWAITTACVMKGEASSVPARAIGLGCDVSLLPSLYKSLLEAAGVWQMAKMVLLQERLEDESGAGPRFDPERLWDFDRNVAYYALPESSGLVDAKFVPTTTVPASGLPPDSGLDTAGELRRLVEGFRSRGMDWVYLDLTTDDVNELGFKVIRAWSPDVLGLCLPSIPPLAHRRFDEFGGATHRSPHPYP